MKFLTEEFFISGDAKSYTSDAPLTSDGNWTARETGVKAPYRVRLIVVRPADASKFNGMVLLEWMNVTGGGDVATEFVTGKRELMRGNYIYVGASVQKAGIEGPRIALPNLKASNPVRYAPLSHPGDQFSYDIFTQIGKAIRNNAGSLIGPVNAKHILAAGKSQSAQFLIT